MFLAPLNPHQSEENGVQPQKMFYLPCSKSNNNHNNNNNRHQFGPGPGLGTTATVWRACDAAAVARGQMRVFDPSI